MSKWSQKLDKYLAINRISKKELASKLGVSINTLQKWWGSRQPSPEHEVKIQSLLGKDLSDPTTKYENSLEPVERATEGDVESQLLERGGREKERSVIVSLLRNKCPFCRNTITRFRHCQYCGQHFVWANMPVDKSQ